MKFAANISTMFGEFEFLSRFEKAKNAGFDYVEIQFPYMFEPHDLSRVQSGVDCVLINSFCSKEYGTASLIGEEVQFLTDLQKIIPYHFALNVQRVHLMAGLRDKRFSFEDQLEVYKCNLNSAVEFLETHNIIGVIEPISTGVKEDYFLNSFETAVEVIKYVDSDHIKLLLDIFHLHNICGNVQENLEVYYPHAGHIQVSNEPGRKEPFCADGKIDYSKVFEFLQEKDYSFPIGLEYYPSGSTVDSLEWMKKYTK